MTELLVSAFTALIQIAAESGVDVDEAIAKAKAAAVAIPKATGPGGTWAADADAIKRGETP